MKLDCYWCEESHYTELGRIYHLYTAHPRFFEEYDRINSWFGEHNIPENPNGDSSDT